MKWPKHPKILEINTWPWLNSLSKKYGEEITLSNVPKDILEKEIKYFDCVWFMGIWKRSQSSIKIAKNHQGLQKDYKEALIDFTDDDIIGSPYAVNQYVVDQYFGGNEGLLVFKKELEKRNKLLILDFVPNHVAIDHPWIEKSPECFILGNPEDFEKEQSSYFKFQDQFIAHGKDPYFPPWTDTAQLNSFSEIYRKKAIGTILEISNLCDGIRCDMAMLMVDYVFQKTWGNKAGIPLKDEFWRYILDVIKKIKPDFKFIAEVYWDMEYELQQQGFDFCYDKRLYDRLIRSSPEDIKGHLNAEMRYQSKLLRFIENHDEPRAFSAFGIRKSIAAAVIALTLPGARLIFAGQSSGKKIKLPVQLGRLPNEGSVSEIADFYRKFLPIWSEELKEGGNWRILNAVLNTEQNWLNSAISYLWEYSDYRIVIIVNYSESIISGILLLNEIENFRNPIKIFEILEQSKLIPISIDSTPDGKLGIPFDLDAWGYKIMKIVKSD
jgi:hypothetical protein